MYIYNHTEKKASAMLAFLLLNLTAVSRLFSGFLGQILGQTTIFLIFEVLWQNHKNRKTRITMRVSIFSIWSGRRDSNSRPLVPETSALPSCATPRHSTDICISATYNIIKQKHAFVNTFLLYFYKNKLSLGLPRECWLLQRLRQ